MTIKHRALIIFLVGFGVVADILSILVARKEPVTGIVIKNLLIISVLFIVQATWYWARITLAILLSTLILAKLVMIASTWDYSQAGYFLHARILLAPVIPLYASIGFITVAGYWLSRRFNLFR
jgi:hypothetical protein